MLEHVLHQNVADGLLPSLGFVLGLAGFGAAGKPLEGVPYSLICYGLLDLIGSVGTLLLAKKIATFAAQT